MVYSGGEDTLQIRLPEIACLFWDNTKRDELNRIEGYKKELLHYPCHLSFRDNICKPQTKIAIAAKCKANIIVNRTSGAVVELLGESYPYMCDFTVESLLDTIKRAKEEYGTSRWKEGLEIMESVLPKVTDEVITKQYIDFFDKLENKG